VAKATSQRLAPAFGDATAVGDPARPFAFVVRCAPGAHFFSFDSVGNPYPVGFGVTFDNLLQKAIANYHVHRGLILAASDGDRYRGVGRLYIFAKDEIGAWHKVQKNVILVNI
jgi:hypothetical protein